MEVLNIPSHVPSRHPATFGARIPETSKTVTYITFTFDRFRGPPAPVIFFTENLPMGCGTAYNGSRVLPTIWIAPECHETTHLWFCGLAMECPRNGRKSCSYARSNSWKCLIYHPMFPRVVRRHSVHGSRRRLKPWLIAFNFDQFKGPPSPIIFFAENLCMGLGTTYNWSRVLRTICITPKCHETTHLRFCGVTIEWPWNGRKSCSYARSNSW